MLNKNTQAICDKIDENPDDRFLLLVLADLMEELNDNRAEGIRHLHEKGFKIGLSEDYKTYHFFTPDMSTFDKPNNFRLWSNISNMQSIWKYLKGGHLLSGNGWGYENLADAILDFSQAYIVYSRKELVANVE